MQDLIRKLIYYQNIPPRVVLYVSPRCKGLKVILLNYYGKGAKNEPGISNWTRIEDTNSLDKFHEMLPIYLPYVRLVFLFIYTMTFLFVFIFASWFCRTTYSQ